LRDIILYFLKLGATGFGGPIALAGAMQRDLVDDRKWYTREQYMRGLALAQLAPGPLAAQLAMYLGWVRGGLAGASLAGIAFVLPSFVMVMALAAFYVRFHGIGWMQAAFYGIGAAVIAIIARSAIKLVKATLKSDVVLWILFAVSAVVTAATEREIVWLFIVAGLIRMIKFSPSTAPIMIAPWLVMGMRGAATNATLTRLFLYFAEAGAFVFGSGLAIVPFLYHGVVEQSHWLTQREFLDAVAVAMITPGPVVITVGFIGFLVAGPLGAIVCALAVFLPCYLFVVIPAPYYERYATKRGVADFVAGVTAAAIGAIAGAAFVLGRRSIVDIPTIIIFVVTLALLWTRRIPEPLLIVLAAIAGLLTYRA
jgi:chromate transporter